MRVSRAKMTDVRPAMLAPIPPMEVRRPQVSKWRAWDRPDGFEVAVFPPRGSRVCVPSSLYMSSDRSWRRTEVP